MKQSLIYAAVLFLASATIANAADFEVVGFSGNGEITWGDTNTNGTYTVQWSSSLQTNWSSDWSALNQIAATGGVLSARIPVFFRIMHHPRQVQSASMRLVSGGGQPQGPQYDFYMAKYEVRNEEFCEFLNDAQANPSNEKGLNMFFNDNGDVYVRTNTSSMMFQISDSRLLYNPANAIGSRFTVYNDYIGHPIVGVSWFGALKYCNWLTIKEGRGVGQRCYNEGPQTTNWHPASLTYAQWNDGFSDIERQQWVQGYTGFRLPMDHNTGTANYYNEFYKAAAWSGASNALYAFGRGTINTQDANYASSKDPFEGFAIQTTPVGYYDGSNHVGTFQTRSNANYWGIFDLSGNVSEWMTDGMNNNYSPDYRGGGWNSGSSSCSAEDWSWGNAYDTYNYRGFRVVSSSP